jgi:hypothetical protein
LLQQSYKVGCKKNQWQNDMDKIRTPLDAKAEGEEPTGEEQKATEDPLCYLFLLSS